MEISRLRFAATEDAGKFQLRFAGIVLTPRHSGSITAGIGLAATVTGLIISGSSSLHPLENENISLIFNPFL